MGYRLSLSRGEIGFEFGQSEYERNYRLGYHYGIAERGRLEVHFGAEVTHRVLANDNDAHDEVAVRANLRW